jgi:VCBS repeat-containing protein
MVFSYRKKALLSLCAFAAVSGCGGGSDSPRPPPNAAPVLTTTTLAATEDMAFAGQLVATDAENNALTFARVNDAQHGQVTISATGAVAYTPAANYSGADTFTVSVNDGAGGVTTGTVTINVAPVNDVPVFTPPTLSTDEDVVLDAGLGTAVTDPDGDLLVFAATTGPAHGALTLSAGGAVAFTPNPDYHGVDSFAVSISDGTGAQVDGIVTINIAAINDAPVLITTQFSVAEDGVLTAQLAAVDVESQPILFQVGGGASHGQVSISPAGLLTYTPAANFNGADVLSVGMTDDGVTLTQQPLMLTVNPVNDPPVAFEDLLRLPANASVALPVLANDSDVDGDELTVTILSQPGGGTLAVNAANVITFTRDNDFNGPIRFAYRVTDAAGVTADADVRAVIGEFPGIYFLSDETTVGQLEVHWFDGLRIYRLGTDLDPGDVISSFSSSDDGRTVAYVVESDTVARVFFTGPDASDSRVIFTSAPRPSGSLGMGIELNRDGTYLRVTDAFAAGGRASYMVRTSDGLQSRIAADTPQIVRILDTVFSPANDDFYVQGQVGGSSTISGTGYATLFRGNATSAGTLTQVGLSYPPASDGGGSGFEMAITSDGRYVLHREVVYFPTRSSVLAYDSVTNTDAPVYRRPVAGEIGMWNGFSLSNDGSRVCFLFREPGGGSSGPSRIVAGSPAAPASAAPVTPVFDFGWTCRLGSDNQTVFYYASTAAEPREQIYAVDAAAPGTPAVVNRPFVAGEQLTSWWVAREAPRHVFGTQNIGVQSDFYSLSLDSPGTYIPFATNVFDDLSLPGQLDGKGYILAYAKRPAPLAGLRRLTLLSTQSASYSFSLTRANTSTGMLQFEWAP